jgi:hypothetical protein
LSLVCLRPRPRCGVGASLSHHPLARRFDRPSARHGRPSAGSSHQRLSVTRSAVPAEAASAMASLSNSPWMRGAPQSIFSILIRRISARRPASMRGRPPRFRDFQRQYRRKPARCQRTSVSGRMIVMALRILHTPCLPHKFRHVKIRKRHAKDTYMPQGPRLEAPRRRDRRRVS